MRRREPVGGVTPEEAARARAAGLLRELLADVQRSEPAPRRALVRRPTGEGTGASDLDPDPGRARRGTVVGVLALSMVSFGGVAAASTGAVPGPLMDLGAAVRSATTSVTGLLGPSAGASRADGPGRAATAAPAPGAVPGSSAGSASPAAPPSVPGTAAAAQPAREVRALLRAAATSFDVGQPELAEAPLSRAEALLAAREDLPGGPALHRWAAALRARLDSLAAGPPDVAGAAPGASGGRAPAAGPAHDRPPGPRPTAAPRPSPHPRPEVPARGPEGKGPQAPAPQRTTGTTGSPAGQPDAPRPPARPAPGGTSGKGSSNRGGG